LAWVATGAAVVGVAFAVYPVHASETVFLFVVCLGVVALSIGCATWIRALASPRQTKRAASAEDRRRVALDCYRLRDELDVLAVECARARPRHGARIRSAGREDEWRSATCARYRDEFRARALQVLDDAVALGAASQSSRALVQAPAATQLTTVRDLFGEIAHWLESF
jgi:hypothetical protein